MASRWKKALAWVTGQGGANRVSGLASVVAATADIEPRLATMSREELAGQLATIPADFISDSQQLTRFLSVARELSDRTVELRAYDVQLQAAAAMLRGSSIEMATGEGKTLVGAIVAAGLVHAGRHVHMLSANDYLAARDAQWMGPLLAAAGASVASVTSSTSHAARVESYRADVVYVSVTEAGFDILRDRVRFDAADLLGMTTDAAILDEADAVLLDEARVPLVLAGEGSDGHGVDTEIADFVSTLREGRDFEIAAERRSVHLSEQGLAEVERRYPDADLFGADHGLLSRINVGLHAQTLLTRDVDYVISEGRVSLVSQSRGRVEALQRWPEGLQAAVEAKEGLTASAEVDVLDQLLVRDLIGLYTTVVGMSATLVPADDELRDTYDLTVDPLPPHQPCIRTDEPDRLYESGVDRDSAALDYVAEIHATGQPVLVATQSVAESERFAGKLAERGVSPVVLNAKNDEQEAHVIAQAGTVGRVTVSTQMAGRGTDIRLGAGASELGGLCIVGIQRFRSERLDGQLRGRSGRQGDPGQTVFFTSLSDEVVSEYLPDHTAPTRVTREGQVEDRRALAVVDQAQRIAQGQQVELRSLARRYGELPSLQRAELLDFRAEVLNGDRATHEMRARIADRVSELEALVTASDLDVALRSAVLSCLDRRWSDHLAFSLELREGIHLRALARLEPLSEYNKLLVESFSSLVNEALDAAAELIEGAEIVSGRIDLDGAGMYRPGATWTYMVTDDHFGSEWARIGRFFAKRTD